MKLNNFALTFAPITAPQAVSATMAFLICAASGEKNSHVKVAAGPDVRRRVDEVEAFRQAIAKLIEQLESAIEALAPPPPPLPRRAGRDLPRKESRLSAALGVCRSK